MKKLLCILFLILGSLVNPTNWVLGCSPNITTAGSGGIGGATTLAESSNGVGGLSILSNSSSVGGSSIGGSNSINSSSGAFDAGVCHHCNDLLDGDSDLDHICNQSLGFALEQCALKYCPDYCTSWAVHPNPQYLDDPCVFCLERQCNEWQQCKNDE